MRLSIMTALVAAILSQSAYATEPFKDVLVQAPSIARPGRGSIAGAFAHVAFGPGELTRGEYTLAAPIDLPNARGPVLASIVPSYSPEAGLSEWGLGWQLDL